MPSPLLYAVAGARIFNGIEFVVNHRLVIENQRIQKICPAKALAADIPVYEFPDCTVAPGLIDIQVNGGGGLLFNNQTDGDALSIICAGHRRHGTTSILPTLISDTSQRQAEAIAAVAQAQSAGLYGIAGLHLEGPFFSKAKRGAHLETFIRPLSSADIEQLIIANRDQIVGPLLLTLAPEACSQGQVQQLVDGGIRVWLGHSNASYQEACAALDEGAEGFTHLFNAMSSIEAREPGMVGAALSTATSYCGIIMDGHHVHPNNFELSLRQKNKGQLMLISDSMATVGSQQQSFDLYGETLTVCDGKLVNDDGRLAGSAISLIDAVRYCVINTSLELDEALRMASTYPAHCLGLEKELGYLKPGMRADMAIFDQDFKVHASCLAGTLEVY